jgi:hypothetical protein
MVITRLAKSIRAICSHDLELHACRETGHPWIRGGFPDSFLAASDAISLRWRQDFIRTYLEREVPQLGPRIPAETLRRLWTMFAHHQGGLLNAAQLAGGLGVSGKTLAHYLDLMVDLLLVRRLPPPTAERRQAAGALAEGVRT